MKITSFLFLALLTFCACAQSTDKKTKHSGEDFPLQYADSEATFAGGCFWCTEAVFERLIGVEKVVSGYAGGESTNPTYKEISRGNSGHAEVVRVYYDSTVLSFETLLDVFFTAAHDPTQVNRQGPDIGSQYRSIAFYQNEVEKKLIEDKIMALEEAGKFEKDIATEVLPIGKFWPAESYHQDYLEKNPDAGPYVKRVVQPKVRSFEKKFDEILKEK